MISQSERFKQKSSGGHTEPLQTSEGAGLEVQSRSEKQTRGRGKDPCHTICVAFDLEFCLSGFVLLCLHLSLSLCSLFSFLSLISLFGNKMGGECHFIFHVTFQTLTSESVSMKRYADKWTIVLFFTSILIPTLCATASVCVFLPHSMCRISVAAVSMDDSTPCCYCFWKYFEDNRCFAYGVLCISIRFCRERNRQFFELNTKISSILSFSP